MATYLNVDAIRNAGDLLNSTLVAKGYMKHKLFFVTTDWLTLTQDQPEKDLLTKLQTQPAIYNNDKNIVNLLYSLMQSIDRHTDQLRALNDSIALRDKTIGQLRNQVAQLELRVRASDTRLQRTVLVEQAVLEERNKQLVRRNRAQSAELTRLRNWRSDLQAKFEVELRRKALEVSVLKDRLLDTRNLSTAISYGKAPNQMREPAGGAPSVNTTLIYENKLVEYLEPRLELVPGGESLRLVVQDEYDGVAAQLSELLESLIRENGKFAAFCRLAALYIAQLNSELAEPALASHIDRFLSPLQAIDMDKVVAATVSTVEPFETVSGPLFARFRENFECIVALVAMVQSPLKAHSDVSSRGEMELLRAENCELRENLKEALLALNGYKEYTLKRQKVCPAALVLQVTEVAYNKFPEQTVGAHRGVFENCKHFRNASTMLFFSNAQRFRVRMNEYTELGQIARIADGKPQSALLGMGITGWNRKLLFLRFLVQRYKLRQRINRQRRKYIAYKLRYCEETVPLITSDFQDLATLDECWATEGFRRPMYAGSAGSSDCTRWGRPQGELQDKDRGTHVDSVDNVRGGCEAGRLRGSVA